MKKNTTFNADFFFSENYNYNDSPGKMYFLFPVAASLHFFTAWETHNTIFCFLFCFILFLNRVRV